MQRSQSLLNTLIKALSCATLALAAGSLAQAADAKKADASGSWTWTSQGRQGGQERKSTLNLKVEGDKVTGKISTPGRDGAAVETTIENGKLSGDDISFTTTREVQNNKITQKYNGKLSGDTIKGKIEFERNGEAQSRDWEAKREGAKKEEPKKAEPEKKN